jgi:hypothetical protein
MRPQFLPLSLLSLVVLVGCPSAPPNAPDGINELTRYLYREWANEDPAVMEEGVAKLEEELKAFDTSSGDYEDRAFSLTAPTREDLATVNWPQDQDPASCTTNISVALLSKWPVTDHAKAQISPDQLDLEPTAKSYTRNFVSPTDPGCFPERGCDAFETLNNVTRKNFFIEVAFDLHKTFRWVKLPGDRWAMVARSWTDRVFPGSDKDTAIKQSYSLDVFMGQADGKTLRYQALYSDTKISVTDRDLVLGTVASSTNDALENGDDVIGKRFHGK